MYKHAAAYADQANKKVPADMTPMQIANRAYNLGSSPHWRAFLKVLAHESLKAEDGWVNWRSICEQIGITRRVASGVLGSGQKHLKGLPVFERQQVGDNYHFRMAPEVAQTIVDLAQAGPDESLKAAGEPA
jgi:hypothetical protein